MSSEDSKSGHNATILAAWITGGLGVLAAVITLVATLHGSGNGSPGGGSSTVSAPVSTQANTPVSSPATGGDTASAATNTPGPAGSVAVVWHHKVRFPSETGLDLRDNQPSIVSITYIPDFETAGGSSGFLLDGGRAASTVAKANPTFGDCTDSFISQSQTGSFDVQPGQTACFQSRDGTRVAAVTVLAWDRVTQAMDADVTVWQAPA